MLIKFHIIHLVETLYQLTHSWHAHWSEQHLDKLQGGANKAAEVCCRVTGLRINTRMSYILFFKGYNGLLQSWPAIFFTLFAGPLSEDYGRKPLIIVGLLGYIVLNIAFFINSWFMYELKAEYLLFECLQDLFGGDIVFSLGIYSLLVDKTEPEARTRRMSILQVAPTLICFISIFIKKISVA